VIDEDQVGDGRDRGSCVLSRGVRGRAREWADRSLVMFSRVLPAGPISHPPQGRDSRTTGPPGLPLRCTTALPHSSFSLQCEGTREREGEREDNARGPGFFPAVRRDQSTGSVHSHMDQVKSGQQEAGCLLGVCFEVTATAGTVLSVRAVNAVQTGLVAPWEATVIKFVL